MAVTTDAQIERTRELIAAVPPGRVTTYGAVAEAAGLTTPRTVAWILRTDGGGVPWQRVVRADGRPAKPVQARQLPLLAAEGAPITGGRVDMRRAFFDEWAIPGRGSAHDSAHGPAGAAGPGRG